jgi:hypothetical protein
MDRRFDTFCSLADMVNAGAAAFSHLLFVPIGLADMVTAITTGIDRYLVTAKALAHVVTARVPTDSFVLAPIGLADMIAAIVAVINFFYTTIALADMPSRDRLGRRLGARCNAGLSHLRVTNRGVLRSNK